MSAAKEKVGLDVHALPDMNISFIGGGSGGVGGASAPPTFRMGVLSTPKYS